MMKQSILSLALLLLQFAALCRGFQFQRLTRFRQALQAVKNADDMVAMRADIERMREEAALRLEALNEKLSRQMKEASDAEPAKKKHDKKEDPPILASLTAPSTSSTSHRVNFEDAKTMDNLVDIADAFERDMHRLNRKKEKAKEVEKTTTEKAQERHPLKLSDNTRWRLMLNVHRVQGTWMPKTWGLSGDQLRLKLEMEFTTEELYEREDFFNGQSDGAKVNRPQRGAHGTLHDRGRKVHSCH